MRQKRRKEKLLALLMLMLTITGCSKGGEDWETVAYDNMGVLVPDKNNMANIPSLTFTFNGVWTVNDTDAGTTNAEVSTGNEEAMFGNYVRFDSYPYQTILDSVLPNKKIESVTISTPADGKLPFRFLGYSESANYLEYVSNDSFASHPFYIKFDVQLEDKSMVYLTLFLTQNKSAATVSPKGESFSCVLAINKIESCVAEGMDAVIQEVLFETELKLKFTSIKRIENATVGN